MAQFGKGANATNLTGATADGVLLHAPFATWTVTHNPGVNVQATASKAAGATGVRHVCTAIMATFSGGTTAPVATVQSVVLRDGASGAGTVIWQGAMALTATAGGAAAPICLSGLCLVGTAATAMTIEFSAAGGGFTFETVSMQGFDVT